MDSARTGWKVFGLCDGKETWQSAHRLVKTSFSKWQFGFSHMAEPNLKMGEGSGECATLAWVREKELKIQVNINASNRNAETSEDRDATNP